MLVQAAETGRDYEHCQALQRRLDDVDSDMRVDDVRIKNMNALADKLIRQGQGDNRAVQQKRDELNQRCARGGGCGACGWGLVFAEVQWDWSGAVDNFVDI